MSGLVDRITAVLREHKERVPSGWPTSCQGCTWRGFDHDAHVAERVAEALNLTEEHYRSAIAPDDCDYDRVRWASAWIAVEEKP